jgi:hypothetical protein
MRIWILALLPCALLAQTSPSRAADQNAFRKLPQRLDRLQPGTEPPKSESSVQLFVSASNVRPSNSVIVGEMLPNVCSIPLLRAPIPKGFIDRMSVPAPPADSIDHMPILTPAVCEDWKP